MKDQLTVLKPSTVLVDIENAAMDSWPTHREIRHGAIRVRSNGGYTKRSNSANIVSAYPAENCSLVTMVEQFYEDKGQSPMFRLVQAPGCELFDEHLACRGYQLVEPSLVMTRQLTCPVAGGDADLVQLSVGNWIEVFYSVSGDSDAFRMVHKQLLAETPAQSMCVAVRDKHGQFASTGLGLVLNGYFGIYNIATAVAAQRQGFASCLINHLMNWAISLHAHTAYLQVRADNLGAIKVYHKLGYEISHRYWYRVFETPKLTSHLRGQI